MLCTIDCPFMLRYLAEHVMLRERSYLRDLRCRIVASDDLRYTSGRSVLKPIAVAFISTQKSRKADACNQAAAYWPILYSSSQTLERRRNQKKKEVQVILLELNVKANPTEGPQGPENGPRRHRRANGTSKPQKGPKQHLRANGTSKSHLGLPGAPEAP